MSNLYCTCGFKNEYSGVKPKFCGACGQPFDKLFKAVVTPPPQPVSVPFTQPNYYQQAQVQSIFSATPLPWVTGMSWAHSQPFQPYQQQAFQAQAEKDFFDLDPSIIRVEGGKNENFTTVDELRRNKNIDFSRHSSAGEEVRDVNLKPLSSVQSEYIEGMIGGKGKNRREQQLEPQAPRRETGRKTARRVSK